MDNFAVLEQKVAMLIDIIKNLKAENSRITLENAHVNIQLKAMQETIMNGAKQAESIDQERAMTCLVVDEIIKNIDSIIETEKQL